MDIEITGTSELFANNVRASAVLGDGGFRQAVEDAVNRRRSFYEPVCSDRGSFVAVSPKLRERMLAEPELAREIAEKIEAMTSGLGSRCKNSMIIIDRSGEVTQYCQKPYDKRAAEREAENAKEAEKSRLRRKARLDAYFKIVQQISMRRKLIEQENIKRPRGKRYRANSTDLDSMVRSILQQPKNPLPYYF